MIQNNFMLCVVVYFLVFIKVSYELCPSGYFKLSSMKFCYPWLSCKDLNEIKIKKLIGFGSTKNVYHAEWRNHNVSLRSLRNQNFKNDFYYGLHVLKSLEPNKHVIQLVGFCELTDTIITEYHEHNNALNYYFLRETLNLKQKFDMCISYVKIINYLHNSPMGTMVNCDSNYLDKLLSQLLITRDLSIILGDVDALPELRINSTITCGKREIKSSFAAPEQIWRESEPFQIKYMNGYDEKIDIWKIPDVCDYFLHGSDYELLQYSLFNIHKKCKSPEPQDRPSAKQLNEMYKKLKNFVL